MKYYLLATLLGAATAMGCKKEEAAAGPTPEGGIWVMATHTIAIIPAGGGPTTAPSTTPYPNSQQLAFVDGQAFLTVSPSLSGNALRYNGLYIFSNGVVTTSFPALGYGYSTYRQQSTLLTDHQLTLVGTDQTTQGTEVSTDTYTR